MAHIAAAATGLSETRERLLREQEALVLSDIAALESFNAEVEEATKNILDLPRRAALGQGTDTLAASLTKWKHEAKEGWRDVKKLNERYEAVLASLSELKSGMSDVEAGVADRRTRGAETGGYVQELERVNSVYEEERVKMQADAVAELRALGLEYEKEEKTGRERQAKLKKEADALIKKLLEEDNTHEQEGEGPEHGVEGLEIDQASDGD